MGHYDEYYEDNYHYAALCKDRKERYEKVQEKFDMLKDSLTNISTDSIEYHLDMLDALIRRELQ